jgi:hypothetical protein
MRQNPEAAEKLSDIRAARTYLHNVATGIKRQIEGHAGFLPPIDQGVTGTPSGVTILSTSIMRFVLALFSLPDQRTHFLAAMNMPSMKDSFQRISCDHPSGEDRLVAQ